MTTKPDARCIIRVNNRPRTLFSISERKTSDDLVIRLKTPKMYFLDGDPTDGIKEQRYSIHTSKESVTKINAIKQTVILKSGRTITTENYTTAVKVENRFAPLFIGLSPNLTPERYLTVHTAKHVIDLGSYDPNSFTLLYAIFVSANHRKFCFLDPSWPFNVASLRFRSFRVTVLWAFAFGASPDFGWTSHIVTVHLKRSSRICVNRCALTQKGEMKQNVP